MKHSRLDTMMLAGIGTLGVHELAYLGRSGVVSASGGVVSHGHLPLLWGFGGAVALGVLARMTIVALRARGAGRRVDPALLAATIAALYVSQEAAELWASGSPAISLLSQPVLWLGLAVTPLVAFVLARLVRTIVAIASLERGSRRRIRSAQVSIEPTPLSPVSALVQLAHSVSRRGPPRLIAYH